MTDKLDKEIDRISQYSSGIDQSVKVIAAMVRKSNNFADLKAAVESVKTQLDDIMRIATSGGGIDISDAMRVATPGGGILTKDSVRIATPGGGIALKGSSGSDPALYTPFNTIERNESHPSFLSWNAKNGRRTTTFAPATGVTRQVSTEAQFNTAMSASSTSGNDAIEISGGPHDWGQFTVNKPVKIFMVNGSYFTGSSFLDSTANNLYLYKLKWQDAAAKYSLRFRTGSNDGVIEDCEWIDQLDTNTSGIDRIMRIQGNNHIIRDNLIHNPEPGIWQMDIGGSTPSGEGQLATALDTLVENNLFSGLGTQTGGGPSIRDGVDAAITRTIFQRNIIDNLSNETDGEFIEMKGSEAQILNNYFKGIASPGAPSLRKGNDIVYYGNYCDTAKLGLFLSGRRIDAVYNYTGRIPSGSIAPHSLQTIFETDGVLTSGGNVPGGWTYKELGLEDCIIRQNVFADFTTWFRISSYSGSSFRGNDIAQCAGNQVKDNYFCNTGGTPGTSSGFQSPAYQDFASFDAQNDITGNYELTGTNGGGPYTSGPTLTPVDVVGNNGTYPPPEWWPSVASQV